ncbi:MAG: MarR family transcriptional regulator [Marmoricola sp.]|nr:MarR family transcriptional regulator [Marmoricola sp.]
MDEALLRALGDEVLRLSGRRLATLPGSRLDSSAFRILWRLEESGPLTLRELAEQLQLEQSTINRQVNSAIKHGLVERVPVPGRAGNPVRPTGAGREAYRHDGLLRAEVMGRAIADLGPGRARDMVDALRAFNDAVDRVHPPEGEDAQST